MENALQKVVQKIIDTADPERIYLLTATTSARKVENVFIAEPLEWQETEHYDVLVLLKGGADNWKHPYLQERLEHHCQQIIPTTVMLLSFSKFNQFIECGNAFIQRIVTSDSILYDAKTKELAAPASGNVEAWEDKNRKRYLQWLENGSSFLAAYDLFMVRKDYRIAAFNLHQAAEQFFLCIFQVAAGFTLSTHNLYALHRYTRGLAREIMTLFPQYTNKDKERFRLLVNAYSQSRYEEDFKIQVDDLLYLQEEVNKLYLIARQFSKRKDEKNLIV